MNIQTTGLNIRKNVPADDNCLFHPVADQLRRLKIKRTRHIDVRREVVHYLRLNPTIVSVDVWIYTIKIMTNRNSCFSMANYNYYTIG